MSAKPTILEMDTHALIYQYQDVPGEWHATCLELAAFGSGSGPAEAMESLMKSVQGLLNESRKHGWSSVFGCGADPEWIRAFNEGKHPADDRVLVAVKGVVTIRATMSERKPKVEFVGPVRIGSSLHLQPA